MIIVYGKQIKRRIRREKGQIKWFDPSKGYGFVERDKGGDLFIHFASVEIKDRKLLKESTRVSFVVTDGLKGPQAKDIKIIYNDIFLCIHINLYLNTYLYISINI